MPRPKGGTLADDHRTNISIGTTERFARERAAIAQEVLDSDQEAFMRGVARGIRNGSIKPKFLRMVLDLAKDAEGEGGE